jgi:hypothetical protein
LPPLLGRAPRPPPLRVMRLPAVAREHLLVRKGVCIGYSVSAPALVAPYLVFGVPLEAAERGVAVPALDAQIARGVGVEVPRTAVSFPNPESCNYRGGSWSEDRYGCGDRGSDKS